MSPQLEYVMTLNRLPYMTEETTIIKAADVYRDGESFAGIYYGSNAHIAVFSYRVPAIFSDEAPYRMIVPTMYQDVTIEFTRPAELHETIAKMANLEFRPL